jgi:hypothetical protein
MEKKNQVPAKLEQKHSKNSELTILNTCGLRLLSECDEEEIKQPIRYMMMLGGLRENNFPTDAEKIVLIEFVQNFYPDYSPEEIKYAFSNAYAGKFPKIEVNPYQNFSAEYIGRVLGAYEKWEPNRGREYGPYDIGHEKIKQGVNQAYIRFPDQRTREDYPTQFYFQMVHDRFIEKRLGNAEKRSFPKQIAILQAFVRNHELGLTELYKPEEDEEDEEIFELTYPMPKRDQKKKD